MNGERGLALLVILGGLVSGRCYAGLRTVMALNLDVETGRNQPESRDWRFRVTRSLYVKECPRMG